MDRDPLHDSALEEAEADEHSSGEDSSTTPMTRAERDDTSRPPVGPGPHGPPVPTPIWSPFMPSGLPAPMPFSMEVAVQTSLHHLGTRRTEAAASAPTASANTSAPGADQVMPLTGWQRQMALQIIEQLHLTCPVYVRAPSLAEIWSWNAVTVSLTPTSSAEAHEHNRVDATDVGGHLWEMTWRPRTLIQATRIRTLWWTPAQAQLGQQAVLRVVLPLATLQAFQALIQVVLIGRLRLRLWLWPRLGHGDDLRRGWHRLQPRRGTGMPEGYKGDPAYVPGGPHQVQITLA